MSKIRFARKYHRGASLTGYGLVVGLIAVVGITAITSTGDSVKTLFGTTADTLDTAVAAGGGAGSTPSVTASVSPPSVLASCLAWYNAGFTSDGDYMINPLGGGGFMAYCDMTTDGGGWTLVAKGSNRSQDVTLSNGGDIVWPLSSYDVGNNYNDLGKFSTQMMRALNPTRRMGKLSNGMQAIADANNQGIFSRCNDIEAAGPQPSAQMQPLTGWSCSGPGFTACPNPDWVNYSTYHHRAYGAFTYTVNEGFIIAHDLGTNGDPNCGHQSKYNVNAYNDDQVGMTGTLWLK